MALPAPKDRLVLKDRQAPMAPQDRLALKDRQDRLALTVP
ncbi:hypothetical protein SAMN05216276_101146 [Streptosporangium subroseum]|uniref:Uncharacterized protein n=1 Tax=Streptosporangium subroseum TaxID=106412 RepID=A0A239F8P0_9ACTN|nr:hypothetical protein SAMN05216276_101146 [Streptosporangium subroseum]